MKNEKGAGHGPDLGLQTLRRESAPRRAALPCLRNIETGLADSSIHYQTDCPGTPLTRIVGSRVPALVSTLQLDRCLHTLGAKDQGDDGRADQGSGKRRDVGCPIVSKLTCRGPALANGFDRLANGIRERR